MCGGWRLTGRRHQDTCPPSSTQRSSPAPGNEEFSVLSSTRLHVSPTSELPAAGRMEPFSLFCRITEAFAILTGVLHVPGHSGTAQPFLGFSKAPILEHELNQINIAFY